MGAASALGAARRRASVCCVCAGAPAFKRACCAVSHWECQLRRARARGRARAARLAGLAGCWPGQLEGLELGCGGESTRCQSSGQQACAGAFCTATCFFCVASVTRACFKDRRASVCMRRSERERLLMRRACADVLLCAVRLVPVDRSAAIWCPEGVLGLVGLLLLADNRAWPVWLCCVGRLRVYLPWR